MPVTPVDLAAVAIGFLFAAVGLAAAAASDLLRAVLDAHRRSIGEGAPLSDDVSVVAIERVV